MMSTYNGAEFLQEQILSIMGQIGVSVSILVRDDGSTDSTCHILDKYKGATLQWYSGENLGWRASFMDVLYRSGDFDYYAFSDQDDVWKEDKLLRAVSFLRKLPESSPQLYFSNLVCWRNGVEEAFAKSPSLRFDKYRCMVQCLSTGNTMVFNKALRDLVRDNPHPEYLLSHDYWIYQTGVLLGHTVYDPESRILYRQHGTNEVGVRRSLRWDIRRKLHDVSIFAGDHRRQRGAQELLRCYGPLMDLQTRRIVEELAFFRSNLLCRMRLFFSRKYVMDTPLRNFLLKMRVLSGRV